MSKVFGIPDDKFFRLAFPRGRFLQHLEDDLTIFAQLIDRCANVEADNFAQKFDSEYQAFHNATAKTIANHRTEMIALFGLTATDGSGIVKASGNTQALLRTQDFPLFFKSFCNKFQYPNCVNSVSETNKQVEAGITLFKPAIFILQLMLEAEKRYPSGAFQVNGAEISNLVFNDLRVARGERSPKDVFDTLVEARERKITFPSDSNHSQHGREFLGYMTLANLLKTDEASRNYSLNLREKDAINYIIKNRISVIFPADFAEDSTVHKKIASEWKNKYRQIWREEESIFYSKSARYEHLTEEITQTAKDEGQVSATAKPSEVGTLDIGDAGELLVLKREKEVIGKIRPDKLPLVVRVANDTSLGYDIQSLEPSDCKVKKFIEVKTTVRTFLPSEEILTYFPMSANEWETARNYKDSYYIYRVVLISDEAKVYVVKNPVGKEAENKIILEPKEYRVILKHEAVDDVYSIMR